MLGGGWFCCCSDVSASHSEADNMSIKAGWEAGAPVLLTPALHRGNIRLTSGYHTRGRAEGIKMHFLKLISIVVLQLTFLAGLHGKIFDLCKTVAFL